MVNHRPFFRRHHILVSGFQWRTETSVIIDHVNENGGCNGQAELEHAHDMRLGKRYQTFTGGESQSKQKGQIKNRHLPAKEGESNAYARKHKRTAPNHLMNSQCYEKKTDGLGEKPDPTPADHHKIQRCCESESQKQPDCNRLVSIKCCKYPPPQCQCNHSRNERERYEPAKIDAKNSHERHGNHCWHRGKHDENTILIDCAIGIVTSGRIQAALKEGLRQ